MAPPAAKRAGQWLGIGLLSLLLAEAGARVLHTPEPVRRVYDPYAYRIPAPGLYDAFRGREGEPVEVRLNELGMRGPSIAQPAEPDALTLVFLGGSSTENYAYPDPDTFPAQVGAEMQRRLGRPVRVFNAGMSAATSGTTLGRLQHQVLDLRPDLVVVMDGVNDLLEGFRKGYRRDGRHLRRPSLADERPRSYLLDWVRQAMGPRVPAAPPAGQKERRTEYADFPARQVFARNLRSVAGIVEAHGLDVLFLTQPTMYTDVADPAEASRFVLSAALGPEAEAYPDVPSLAAGMRAFNGAVLELPRSSHVHVFDLAARLPRSFDLVYDDCHFTRAGNRRVAAELGDPVEELLRKRPGPPSTP
jgi:lysophospholipase L1-like esterase